MHRIDGPTAAPGGLWTEGDPIGGVPATIVSDDYMNDLQENVMAVLTAAGVSPTKGRAADLLDSIKALTTGKVLAIRQITSTGVYTPTPGTKTCYGFLIGAGAAGGGAQSTATGNTAAGIGGSAGSMAEFFFPVATLSGLLVTIGTGGLGVANGAGNNGGQSTFGPLTAPGGNGGAVGVNSAAPWLLGEGGNSTSPTGGNLANIPGQSGGMAFGNSSTTVVSGRGGSGRYGTGGNSRGNVRGNGSPGIGYGAGGGGAVESSAGPGGLSGGNGTNGLLMIWELG